MAAAAPLGPALRDEIRQRGPMSFGRFMERALYDPMGGFYAATGSAGRSGDFLTSPEVGPLFGAVLARALDAWWVEAGRPDPFTVAEVGAGVGTLAISVVAARPRCGAALRYVLVERSSRLAARHGDHLALRAESGEPDWAAPVSSGPELVSRPELPAEPALHVVLANELLDNLPFDLFERRRSGWEEIRVGWADDGSAPGLVAMQGPAPAADQLALTSLAPEAPVGGRVARQDEAATWLGHVLDRIDRRRGRVVVIDYATTSEAMATRPMEEWLRTYRAHQPGAPWWVDPGDQDITAEVALDQLARVRRPDRVTSQADWLAEHGMAELVAEGRARWAERGHLGDLAAIAGRSRVREAEALADPAGLGAFVVAVWSPDG